MKCLVIPAASAHGFIKRLTILLLGNENTFSSAPLPLRTGSHFNASDDNGRYIGALVFCITTCRRYCPLSQKIFSHFKPFMSLKRSPQKQENKYASFMFSFSIGVAISFFTSSMVMYSRLLSGTFSLSELPSLVNGFTFSNSSLTAAFNAPFIPR